MGEQASSELLDHLLQGVKTPDDPSGQDGVLQRLTGALVERVLRAELDCHLATAPSADRANGTTPKRLETDHGDMSIAVPRDRAGTFEPVLLPQRSSRLAGLDDKILALYARGLRTCEIEQHLAALYGTSVSASRISEVAEAVRDEVFAWQSRPREPWYVVVWLDALGKRSAMVSVIRCSLRDGSPVLSTLWRSRARALRAYPAPESELRMPGRTSVNAPQRTQSSVLNDRATHCGWTSKHPNLTFEDKPARRARLNRVQGA